MKMNKLASKSSIRNFCMKFHTTLMLSWMENLFKGRAATKLFYFFSTSSTVGSSLRSFQESALVCKIKEESIFISVMGASAGLIF